MRMCRRPAADQALWQVLPTAVPGTGLWAASNGKKLQLIWAKKEFMKEYGAAPRISRKSGKQVLENGKLGDIKEARWPGFSQNWSTQSLFAEKSVAAMAGHCPHTGFATTARSDLRPLGTAALEKAMALVRAAKMNSPPSLLPRILILSFEILGRCVWLFWPGS